MSKRKKEKKQQEEQSETVIKPDVKVNVEIDYDKLAEAIIKAEKKSEDFDDKSAKYLFALQKNGTSMLYMALGIMGYIFSGLIVIALIATAFIVKWSSAINVISNVLTFFAIAIAVICLFIMSVFLHKSSKEIEKIKDKQMLMSLSSGLIGFIALIAAIVAIFAK